MQLMENKKEIDWRIAYNELSIQFEFLRQRNLTLAHQLAATQAAFDALSNPREDMVKEPDGVSK